MLTKLKNIFNTNRYYVIGISGKRGVYEYQLIELSFNGSELKIENRFFSNDFDTSFKEKISKDYPVILHIEGDNIINKEVENKTGYRKNLIYKADPEDFYFFEYHQQEIVYISVARKHHINEVMKQVSDMRLYIVFLSFGPFVMANLLSIIKGYSKISSSNYTIDINKTEILSFANKEVSDNEYIIDGDVFNQNEISLLASFLGYKFSNPAIDFDDSFLKINRDEFKFKKWFKLAGVFVLIFFMVSLVISHFLMSTYTKKLTEKESLYAISQQTSLEVKNLKEEKVLKEKILKTSGIGNKSFITKYIADIGNSVTSSVSLNTIRVMSPIKKIKASKKISFDINVITVIGETTNDNSFNEWLKRLRKLSWVTKIDIDNYTQESKKINVFKIKIGI